MPDAAGKSFEEPDMRTGIGKIDLTEPFPSHFCLSNFHPTLVADHTSMLHAFVFTAEAFPIRHWTKYTSTEQTITFRLERPVVDCFGLGHLTMRPLPDLLR